MKINDYNDFVFDNKDYLVLINEKRFSKTASGKGWHHKPDSETFKVFKPINYTYYITAIPFFNNFGDGASCKAVWGDTMAGYLPVKVETISPFKKTRVVASFKFINKKYLLKKAGWREAEIVNNAARYKTEIINNKTYLTIYTNKDGAAGSGMIRLYDYTWVN